jgi:hypothetical protein
MTQSTTALQLGFGPTELVGTYADEVAAALHHAASAAVSRQVQDA